MTIDEETQLKQAVLDVNDTISMLNATLDRVGSNVGVLLSNFDNINVLLTSMNTAINSKLSDGMASLSNNLHSIRTLNENQFKLLLSSVDEYNDDQMAKMRTIQEHIGSIESDVTEVGHIVPQALNQVHGECVALNDSNRAIFYDSIRVGLFLLFACLLVTIICSGVK